MFLLLLQRCINWVSERERGRMVGWMNSIEWRTGYFLLSVCAVSLLQLIAQVVVFSDPRLFHNLEIRIYTYIQTSRIYWTGYIEVYLYNRNNFYRDSSIDELINALYKIRNKCTVIHLSNEYNHCPLLIILNYRLSSLTEEYLKWHEFCDIARSTPNHCSYKFRFCACTVLYINVVQCWNRHKYW